MGLFPDCSRFSELFRFLATGVLFSLWNCGIWNWDAICLWILGCWSFITTFMTYCLITHTNEVMIHGHMELRLTGLLVSQIPYSLSHSMYVPYIVFSTGIYDLLSSDCKSIVMCTCRYPCISCNRGIQTRLGKSQIHIQFAVNSHHSD